MSTSTGTHLTDAAEYAAAVRRHLVGLSPEQVEDLTDDLEADLADALADDAQRGTAVSGDRDLVARFGEPAAYAAELRTSAGLPDAVPGVGRLRRAVRAPGRVLGARREQALAALRPLPWWDGFAEFAVAFQPIVWFARAWVLYQVLRTVLSGAALVWMPRTFGGWVALLALTVVSVQWGRGHWVPGVGGRVVRRSATVLAVVALLPVVATVVANTDRVNYVYETQTLPGRTVLQDGVVVDGIQVSNLFTYDAQGMPLEDVQIFDDRGRPVRTIFDDGWSDWSLPGISETWGFLPVPDVDGRDRWNVYPLAGAPSSAFEYTDEGERELTGDARTPPRPFAVAPALDLPGVGSPGSVHEDPATAVTPGAGAEPSAAPTTAVSPEPAPTP